MSVIIVRVGEKHSKICLPDPEVTGPDKHIFKCFYDDYTLITDIVLGQWFYRIIRFKNLVFKADKN